MSIMAKGINLEQEINGLTYKEFLNAINWAFEFRTSNDFTESELIDMWTAGYDLQRDDWLLDMPIRSTYGKEYDDWLAEVNSILRKRNPNHVDIDDEKVPIVEEWEKGYDPEFTALFY